MAEGASSFNRERSGLNAARERARLQAARRMVRREGAELAREEALKRAREKANQGSSRPHNQWEGGYDSGQKLTQLDKISLTVWDMRKALGMLSMVEHNALPLKPLLSELKKEFTVSRRIMLAGKTATYTERANAKLNLPPHTSLEDGWDDHDQRWNVVKEDIKEKLSAWKQEVRAAFDMPLIRRTVENIQIKRLTQIEEFKNKYLHLTVATETLEQALENVTQGMDAVLAQLSDPAISSELVPNIDFIAGIESRVKELKGATDTFEKALIAVKNDYNHTIRIFPDTVWGEYKRFSTQIRLPADPSVKKRPTILTATAAMKRLARPSGVMAALKKHRPEIKRLNDFEERAEIAEEAGSYREFDTTLTTSLVENARMISLLGRLVETFKRSETKKELLLKSKEQVIQEFISTEEWPPSIQEELTKLIRQHPTAGYTSDLHTAVLRTFRDYKKRYQKLQNTLSLLDDKGWYERKKDIERQPDTLESVN